MGRRRGWATHHSNGPEWQLRDKRLLIDVFASSNHLKYRPGLRNPPFDYNSPPKKIPVEPEHQENLVAANLSSVKSKQKRLDPLSQDHEITWLPAIHSPTCEACGWTFEHQEFDEEAEVARAALMTDKAHQAGAGFVAVNLRFVTSEEVE